MGIGSYDTARHAASVSETVKEETSMIECIEHTNGKLRNEPKDLASLGDSAPFQRSTAPISTRIDVSLRTPCPQRVGRVSVETATRTVCHSNTGLPHPLHRKDHRAILLEHSLLKRFWTVHPSPHQPDSAAHARLACDAKTLGTIRLAIVFDCGQESSSYAIQPDASHYGFDALHAQHLRNVAQH